MTTMTAIDYIRQRFGPVPQGWVLEVIEQGQHFLAGPCYLITLTGHYNGKQYTAGDVLIRKNFSYVTAIRDNLKWQHYCMMEVLEWEDDTERQVMMDMFGQVPQK